MCKKIYIILFLIVFMVGCSEKKETNIRESFVDKDWYRPTDVCGENLCFASDGTFWYYEDCGSAVEDYDCYDEYSYDKKTGIITLHEIDVILMKGMIPVFVSCKNGNVEEDELYKLDTVASRFGGTYAKKVLIATKLGKKPGGVEHFKQRARDMKIHLIDGVHEFDDARFQKMIRNLGNS